MMPTPLRFVTDFHGAEHDGPAQARPGDALRSYVICSTPRCGSGLLCRALSATGVVGVPLEYFNPVTRATLSQRWGCGRALGGYVDALHSRRAPEGLFATKVHWDQLALIRAEAQAGTHDRFVYETADDLLDRLFPQARFVRIVRQDLDRQAVSYWRALHSNVWSVGNGEPAGGVEREPRYDYGGIDGCRREVEQGELCWDRLLRAHGKDALVVTYEELDANFTQTVKRVAGHVSPEASVTVSAPRTRRLSDECSLEFCSSDSARTEPR